MSARLALLGGWLLSAHAQSHDCNLYEPFRLQRPQPDPPVPAATYAAQPKGHFNWGQGICLEGWDRIEEPERCREHCDADPTCLGYEVGDENSEWLHGVHCCLERCSPPETGDGKECSCWVSGTVPDGWTVTESATADAQAWTYYHKVAAAVLEPGSGSGSYDLMDVGKECLASKCDDYGQDCCTRPELGSSEVQTCIDPGFYPVGIGWCGGDQGLYTCCPFGVTPSSINVERFPRCEVTSRMYTDRKCVTDLDCEPYREELCESESPCMQFYSWAEGGHEDWCKTRAVIAISIALGVLVIAVIGGIICCCCCCPGCPCNPNKRQPPPNTLATASPAVQMNSAVASALPMAVAQPIQGQPMAVATAVPMTAQPMAVAVATPMV